MNHNDANAFTSAYQFAKEKEEAKRGLYTAYLEDLGRIGGRHETARAFYLSLITALSGFLALATTVYQDNQAVFIRSITVTGLIVCGAWFLHMFSFGTLFAAKRDVLEELEKALIAHPFTLEKQKRSSFHWRLTVVDRIVAAAFFLFFLRLLAESLA